MTNRVRQFSFRSSRRAAPPSSTVMIAPPDPVPALKARMTLSTLRQPPRSTPSAMGASVRWRGGGGCSSLGPDGMSRPTPARGAGVNRRLSGDGDYPWSPPKILLTTARVEKTTHSTRSSRPAAARTPSEHAHAVPTAHRSRRRPGPADPEPSGSDTGSPDVEHGTDAKQGPAQTGLRRARPMPNGPAPSGAGNPGVGQAGWVASCRRRGSPIMVSMSVCVGVQPSSLRVRGARQRLRRCGPGR